MVDEAGNARFAYGPIVPIKPGVDVSVLSPQILLAIAEAREVYRKYGVDLTLTSGRDGVHGVHTLHKHGHAVDLRIWNLPEGSPPRATEQIAKALGEQFDVVLESDHIHMEYDPRP